MQPVTTFEIAKKSEDSFLGKKLIAEGKVGAIILAGGVGSRLGFDGPKGAFILPHIKKSLFEILFQKVPKGSSIAIMTSLSNHKETEAFLLKHQYFGLSQHQVDLFIQESLPYLDDAGNPIKGTLAPFGNGSLFRYFYKNNLWEKWKTKGIEQILVVPIDNPLADPFDPVLVEFHAVKQDEVTIKCIARSDPYEKVGVLVKIDHKIKVVEYTELSEKDKTAVDESGNLLFSIANISLFSFSMDFAKKVADVDLPIHVVKKKALISGKMQEVQKREQYIFDLLEYATKVSVLLYPRAEVFSPIKGVEDVQRSVVE